MLTVLREREILEAEGAYVAPSGRARGGPAKLAAEDAEREEKAAARKAAVEAEAATSRDRARPRAWTTKTITDDHEEEEA